MAMGSWRAAVKGFVKHSAFDHSSARKFDDEHAPAWRAVLDSDRTALRLDREPTEREPKPRRFVAGGAPQPLGAVRLEDPGPLFRRHSGPVIVNRDVGPVPGTGDDHAHPPL